MNSLSLEPAYQQGVIHITCKNIKDHISNYKLQHNSSSFNNVEKEVIFIYGLEFLRHQCTVSSNI